MAKELPYFKFEPAEYLTKNISFCSLSAQGLFVNVCSYYWQRNCKLTKEQVLRRLNYETELNELIAEGIIDLKDEFIVIKFLDNQLKEVEEKSKTNSKNGKLGGRPKKPKESEKKPNALNSLSETKGIREDEIILDDIREDKIILDEVEKENTFHDINILKNHYLTKTEILKAVINNKDNKVKDIEDLKIKLHLFCNDLKEQGRLSETWKEFSSYFRNCLRLGKFEVFNHININNPNNEKIIRYYSNVNPTPFELPESKFLELKERNKDGGYKYTIIS